MNQSRPWRPLFLLLLALVMSGTVVNRACAQSTDTNSPTASPVASSPTGTDNEQQQQQQVLPSRLLRRRGKTAVDAGAPPNDGRDGGVPPLQPPSPPPQEKLAARRWMVVYQPAAVAQATAAFAVSAAQGVVGSGSNLQDGASASFIRPMATARLFSEWSLQPERSISFPNGLAIDVISNASAARDLISGTGAVAAAASEVATVELEGLVTIAASAALMRPPRFRIAKQSRPPSWGLDRVDQRPKVLNSVYGYPRFQGLRSGDGGGGGGVDVYVIDTGVRTTHTQFSGGRATMVKTYFPPVLTDDFGHGTHVAGTIGGITVGVAKQAIIKGIKVLDKTGYGVEGDIIDAIGWVVSQCRSSSRRCVINMSIGAPRLPTLNAAIRAAWDAGVISVVAAGNNDEDVVNMSPASEVRAVTVGASTATDMRAFFSNWGATVDLYAPGYDIASASWLSDYDFAYMSGTSMAAPHVTGTIANIWTAKPTLTAQQVVDELISRSTKNVVYDLPNGTPNRLLYTALW